MYRALKFSFVSDSDSFGLHQFKNFGELIYVEFREDFAVSIHEIDTTRRDFYVRKIHKRDARAAAKRARKIAESEQAFPFVQIVEVDDEK